MKKLLLVFSFFLMLSSCTEVFVLGVKSNSPQGWTAFNQDLTSWCVTNIAAEPSGFASSSSLTNANKPVWGTCPP